MEVKVGKNMDTDCICLICVSQGLTTFGKLILYKTPEVNCLPNHAFEDGRNFQMFG
jgi:hypothetical protein